MNNFLNLINPWSSKYHALEKFSELKKTDKAMTLALTFFATCLSLGFLTTPVFRLLVNRLKKIFSEENNQSLPIKNTMQVANQHFNFSINPIKKPENSSNSSPLKEDSLPSSSKVSSKNDETPSSLHHSSVSSSAVKIPSSSVNDFSTPIPDLTSQSSNLAIKDTNSRPSFDFLNDGSQSKELLPEILSKIKNIPPNTCFYGLTLISRLDHLEFPKKIEELNKKYKNVVIVVLVLIPNAHTLEDTTVNVRSLAKHQTVVAVGFQQKVNLSTSSIESKILNQQRFIENLQSLVNSF